MSQLFASDGQSFSLGRGRIQEIYDGECYTMSMNLVPLNCTVKYGKSCMFHIMCLLLQSKKKFFLKRKAGGVKGSCFLSPFSRHP